MCPNVCSVFFFFFSYHLFTGYYRKHTASYDLSKDSKFVVENTMADAPVLDEDVQSIRLEFVELQTVNNNQ